MTYPHDLVAVYSDPIQKFYVLITIASLEPSLRGAFTDHLFVDIINNND
jgi:hypothetical protein